MVDIWMLDCLNIADDAFDLGIDFLLELAEEWACFATLIVAEARVEICIYFENLLLYFVCFLFVGIFLSGRKDGCSEQVVHYALKVFLDDSFACHNVWGCSCVSY